MCPMCRSRIHEKDVPSKKKLWIQDLVKQPAISAMPVDQRPFRLARETIVIQRVQIRSASDALVEQRANLLENQAPQEQASKENIVDQGSSTITSDADETDDELIVIKRPKKDLFWNHQRHRKRSQLRLRPRILHRNQEQLTLQL